MRASRWIVALVIGAIGAAIVWLLLREDGGVVPMPPPATHAQRDAAASAAAGETPAAVERSAATAATAGLTLRGRVVDAWGEPVASAMVGDATSPEPVTSGSDGRFVLHGPIVASLQLLVLADGHAPALPVITIPDGANEHDAGDVQLLRGGALRGRVVDASGRGVAGAALVLRAQPAGPWPPGLDREALHASIASDGNGEFTFPALAPGSYRVRAAAAGKQTATTASAAVADASVTALEPLVLADGHELAGVVLGPDDAPVAAASVHVRARGQVRFDGQVATGDDGRFRIGALPPVALHVEVVRAGFLRAQRDGVDATRGEELVVRLEAGLRIHGVAVDAATGRPVERFAAAVHRIGELDPDTNGSVVQQLERQIAALRDAAGDAAADDARRADSVRLQQELAARLARVRQLDPSRPVVVPEDTGEVAARPGGTFAFDGLEEGLYAVAVASPEHRYSRQAPVEVRRGGAVPQLTFALASGGTVAGSVVAAAGGGAVAGASVELVRIDETAPDPDASARSLFPWVFAGQPRRGITVMHARSAGDGAFTFRNVAPGRYAVAALHERFADHDGDVFAVGEGRRDVRVELGARASLRGRVTNVPAAMRGNVAVLLLGGHGTLKTVRAAADDTYRCELLQPGSYLVRAFPADATRYVDRLCGELFPLHAGAVDPAKIPPRDAELAPGEQRVLDLTLDVPATGAVQGNVAINGQPARGANASLRPVPGEAPGSGGLTLRATIGDGGAFAIADVPVGNYTFVVTGQSRQQLHDAPLTIESGAPAVLQLDLAAGGIRGRVTAADGTPAADLRGYVWVLPGVKEAPPDLHEYRRAHRTHRVTVTNGTFQDPSLTPGPAVAVVDLRGRQRTLHTIVVPKNDTLTLDLDAGQRAP